MPRSIACDYCGDDIEPGTGTMFVRLNGQTVHFCSSKCEKNADLGREARDLEWTEAGRTTRGRMAEAADVAAGAEEQDADLDDQDVDAVDDVDADETEDEATDDAGTEESDEDADEETEEAQA
jgi:large subunit ribosomal protein L24e